MKDVGLIIWAIVAVSLSVGLGGITYSTVKWANAELTAERSKPESATSTYKVSSVTITEFQNSFGRTCILASSGAGVDLECF